MKVSLMAQVFSFKVGSLMKRISQWGLQYDNSLPAEAVQTADFILFMDMLFDSLNGNAKQAPVSKPFKGGVSTDSGHKKWWEESVKVIKTMRFWNSKKGIYVKVPWTKNLVKTIEGFLYLRTRLLTRVKYFLPRALNQEHRFVILKCYIMLI
ncbi:hypothetical protein Zmor_010842 [Zophobas morio]|uniref:Uncharacterized protein n=1 Tax=Zophobas morio TaxID=2755281 RepID=A0AA38MKC2_9CUCU|nr:hypothetical protein Zmor_010842 [Zophobas morio]